MMNVRRETRCTRLVAISLFARSVPPAVSSRPCRDFGLTPGHILAKLTLLILSHDDIPYHETCCRWPCRAPRPYSTGRDEAYEPRPAGTSGDPAGYSPGYRHAKLQA